ncbi:alpha/beta hydrolase [Massilia sp. Dwa41.01b]|uniref:esterase/lipase family protein n=1 Tax=unclassified Massilia TaxID=2609279 RepID=UPI0015FFF37F|nr:MULTISPECIES: alpha/beta hydrolase [unclassified Massilia]QNA88345.1 alpha/beta hydrolase [Massilia sp. Dwa41.01b]QNA99244.1 alpha/beta hydrolase [Massilia sp. Se16.2.3]
MAEPIRRLPDPIVNADGKLEGKSILTPQSVKTRGAIAIPSNKVIPVILVPGIMGSNLRATTNKKQAQNTELSVGNPAWRPPNGVREGLREAKMWDGRGPAVRQQILDGDTLEVDNTGLIEPSGEMEGMTVEQLRNRWWGEVHWSSYGPLLCELQSKLNSTFEASLILRNRQPNSHWESIMEYDHEKWNAADMSKLTVGNLEKFAQYQYPVYACGYNWTQSNELSGIRLKTRVLEIIDLWIKRKFDCKQVILVTHSMGGLVARACAKQIPDRIVGISHGVMPALGAPLAYRRMACGTEKSSPSATIKGNFEMEKFSQIAGDTTEKTTPTMAMACGALELLPNHLYPQPWLMASVRKRDGSIEDVCPLFYQNVYDLYREFSTWYRVIDLDLVDPARKYDPKTGEAKRAVIRAVGQAEKFHTQVLDSYYHPNSYAYYGADPEQLSFGVFRWITDDQGALNQQVRSLLIVGQGRGTNFNGGKTMIMPENFVGAGSSYFFMPGAQDAPGDGTVSHQSGDGPRGRVKRVFRTTGFSHQGSYKDEHMISLTFNLIARIVQEAK